MVDRPPPQRWRVEERGGRLVVIDTLTGAPPPTAAERHGSGHAHMAMHSPTPTPAPTPRSVPQAAAKSAPVRPVAAPSARKPSAMPWASNEARPRDRARVVESDRTPEAARVAPRESPVRETLQSMQGGAAPRMSAPRASTTLTTRRWYDAKGPRTILLSQAAQDRQQKMLMWFILALMLSLIAIVLISPVILFVLAFALLRGGREVVAQAGAKWIDSLEAASG